MLSIALELFFWLVPQYIVSAIAVAFLGFFLGPLYPAAIVSFLSLSLSLASFTAVPSNQIIHLSSSRNKLGSSDETPSRAPPHQRHWIRGRIRRRRSGHLPFCRGSHCSSERCSGPPADHPGSIGYHLGFVVESAEDQEGRRSSELMK